MNTDYTFFKKSLLVCAFLSLGLGINDTALAEYFDGYYQNGQWANQQERSVQINQSREGQVNAWGNGSGQGQASGDAEGEIEFAINFKAKARTNTQMQQSRQFEGFMAQMRQMNQQMFQQRNFSNQIYNQYGQEYYPTAYTQNNNSQSVTTY